MALPTAPAPAAAAESGASLLELEIAEIAHSVAMLEQSQAALKEALAEEPAEAEYKAAISENIVVRRRCRRTPTLLPPSCRRPPPAALPSPRCARAHAALLTPAPLLPTTIR